MVNYYKEAYYDLERTMGDTISYNRLFLGLNIGFWFSMLIVLIIALIMNVVFWSMPPQKNKN